MFRNTVDYKYMTYFSEDDNFTTGYSAAFNNRFSRVWIKCGSETNADGNWLLIKGLLKLNTEDNSVDITSFITNNVFGYNDFIFCYRSKLEP